MKNNNAWNIRHLVDESFVPLTQRSSILYWRLSDFILAYFAQGLSTKLILLMLWSTLVLLIIEKTKPKWSYANQRVQLTVIFYGLYHNKTTTVRTWKKRGEGILLNPSSKQDRFSAWNWLFRTCLSMTYGPGSSYSSMPVCWKCCRNFQGN